LAPILMSAELLELILRNTSHITELVILTNENTRIIDSGQ